MQATGQKWTFDPHLVIESVKPAPSASTSSTPTFTTSLHLKWRLTQTETPSTPTWSFTPNLPVEKKDQQTKVSNASAPIFNRSVIKKDNGEIVVNTSIHMGSGNVYSGQNFVRTVASVNGIVSDSSQSPQAKKKLKVIL